jgi:uncharacterized protein (DUF2267 family)
VTVPFQYQRAKEEFFDFLDDARELADLMTANQAYTMVQGVLQAFRRRLDLKSAIRFAGVLPVGLRALFVAEWDPDEPTKPFEELSVMTREARELRAQHNFSPDHAIRAVALAIRRHVDEEAFERVLATLPEGARLFWKP